MKYNLVNYQSDNKENPGFISTLPLRGASRGRSGDVLILYVLPAQNSDYWQANLGKLTQTAAMGYYQSPGSVTNAMRGAVETLNHALRLQNSGLRLDRSPEQAAMMLGVLRDGALYLGQAGHASALLVGGAGTKLFFDNELEQRGLGLSDLLDIRFFRTEFYGGDYLLLGVPKTLQAFENEGPTPGSVIRLVSEATDLADAFSLTRIGLGEKKIENRMLSKAMQVDDIEQEDDPEAIEEPEVLSEAEEPEYALDEGSQTLDGLQLSLPIDEVPTVTVATEDRLSEADEGEEEIATTEELADEEIQSEEAESSLADDLVDEASDYPDADIVIDISPEDAHEPKAEIIPDELPETLDELKEAEVEPLIIETQAEFQDESVPKDDIEHPEPEEVLSEGAIPETKTRRHQAQAEEPEMPKQPDAAAIARQERLEKLKQGALTGVARGAGWLRGIEENAQASARRATQRASTAGQEIPSLSPFAKWAIVIIVPLIVVAIAVSIYFTRGLNRQYVYFVKQARAEIQLAPYLNDDVEKRQAWSKAIEWLNQAREFNQGDTSEISDLRNEAQAGIDRLDGVKRLLFKNAFGKTVYPDLEISQLVPGLNVIYALDKNTGKVLRFYLVGDTYMLDNKFHCGPGVYGDVELGQIIDITDLTGGSPNNADVMGIDANGAVLYCSKSGEGQIATQLQAPKDGFGSVDSIHYGNDGLYVMDVENNKIWVYRGLNDLFPYEPGLFLDSRHANLAGAIDMVVRREGLFVLYADGRKVFSNVPSYSGFEPAHETGANMQALQGNFSQISSLGVADDLLYYLEPSEPAIARYTYRLMFNDILKVSFGKEATPSSEATAIAISNTKFVFLAFDNQLFFAPLP